MQFDISVAWALGLAFAVARAGAFVALCAFIPRSIPGLGRTAIALAIGIFIAQPVTHASMSSADLVVAAVTNLVIGGVLGWFVGLLTFMFQVAGSVVDVTSGVSLGSVFDPDTGNTPGPFAKFYTLSAQTLIIAGGGLTVIIQVAWVSTKAIPLDGHLASLKILGSAATSQVDQMFHRGVELALPVAAVLFVAELAFGLLSRLAPQINMFLIALPIKTLMVISMLGTACVVFPRFADQAISGGLDTAARLLGR
ncbi:MAG: fliR [Ilumatobacteraceae bacterium]|nr:fliR [Ilumatobacteraceae bacterium]MCU1388472.1 fliR [Ilumatobacteraceae bacterium]